MSLNGVEEFVGEYLKIVEGCDFVKYNTAFKAEDFPDETAKGTNKLLLMGECDIIGIRLEKKNISGKVFMCEVSAQLGGFTPQYKEKIPKKLTKNKKYFETNLKPYFDCECELQFWAPFFKNTEENEKYIGKKMGNEELRKINDCQYTFIEGEEFLKRVKFFKEVLLGKKAPSYTDEKKERKENFSSPVTRFLQVVAFLEKKDKK
ncbi:MAG: hypothetical protein IJ752_01820 [Alphaproteobacteria bacterium]|nr:hypothetical protein [Alphaproteobacteria bacterium]